MFGYQHIFRLSSALITKHYVHSGSYSLFNHYSDLYIRRKNTEIDKT